MHVQFHGLELERVKGDVVNKMADMWRNQKICGAKWAIAAAPWATMGTKVGALRARSRLTIHPNKIKNCLNEYQRYHYSRL
jgi:hypothetical protein